MTTFDSLLLPCDIVGGGGSGMTAYGAESLRVGMEKLFELAGSEDIRGVIDKINNGRKLNESLMDQCKDHEVMGRSRRGEEGGRGVHGRIENCFFFERTYNSG